MWITQFKNYKIFLKELIKTFPKKGHGQAKRLADHLGIAPMVLSHILSRERDFTPDQGLRVAAYFGLSERETDYFLNMVYMERAESNDLRKVHEQKLAEIRKEADDIKNVVQGRDELTEIEKATFYSNWYYCAVFVLSSIKEFQTVSAIANYLRLSPKKVGSVVAFLLDTGLLVQEEGRLRPGKKSIHLADGSELLNNHRRNWREIASNKFSESRPGDVFFSCPVSISKKDSEEFRKELLELIAAFSKRVAISPEEKAMCLNVDWFEF